jgi:hypothetical protein
VRLSHDPAKTHASFDDPNLVSRAGLIPLMALAGRCGLADLAGEHVKIASRAGVNAHLKIPGLVAGMAAGGRLRSVRVKLVWRPSADSRSGSLSGSRAGSHAGSRAGSRPGSGS